MKALIVIDMQEIAVGKNHAKYFDYDNENFINDVNQIIAERNAKNRHKKVENEAAIEEEKATITVYVRNIMKQTFLSKFAPFQAYKGTKAVKLVEGLNVVSDYVFDKYEADAFSNPDLDKLLKEKGVTEVELVGLDGTKCVAKTAEGALKRGYATIVNTRGIRSRNPDAENRIYDKLQAKGLGIL